MEDIHGPLDGSVLYQQENHRSRNVVDGKHGGIDGTLVCRHHRPGFYAPESSRFRLEIHHRVIMYLYDIGFYGMYRAAEMDIDRHLITALVERWRPETHTFHLPVAEATVTLEDVAILWGLPIRGRAVTGADLDSIDWGEACQRLLGFTPSNLKGWAVKLTDIRTYMTDNPIGDGSSEQEVLRWARCAIMLLMGCVMWPDSSGNIISLIYLTNLGYRPPPAGDEEWVEDVPTVIQEVASYSWGSALLAQLYRELCFAARRTSRNIGGALQLLQIWALSRITPLAPSWVFDKIDVGAMPVLGVDLHPAPYGAHWVHYNSWVKTVAHNVRMFREVLDRLTPNQFVWRPYDAQQAEYEELPEYVGRELWMARVPLINWATVEWHYPNRVARQFGYVQGIPLNVDQQIHDVLHDTKRQGKTGRSWAQFHEISVQRWANKEHHIHQFLNGAGIGMTEDYWSWYLRITRRWISPISHGPGISGNFRIEELQNLEGYHPPDVTFAWNVDETATSMIQTAVDISDYNDAARFQVFREEVIRQNELLRDMARLAIGLGEAPAHFPTQPTQARRRAQVPDEMPRQRRRRRHEPAAADQGNTRDAHDAEIPQTASRNADCGRPNSAPMYQSQEVGEGSNVRDSDHRTYEFGAGAFMSTSPYNPQPYHSPEHMGDAFGMHDLTPHLYDQSAPDTQEMEEVTEEPNESVALTLIPFAYVERQARNECDAALDSNESRDAQANQQPVVRRVQPYRDRRPPNCGRNSCTQKHR